MMTGKSMRMAACLASLLLMLAANSHASVTASVDRTVIGELDTLTLTLRASNDAADLTPDFSSLNADFNILNNQNRRQSSYSINNGQVNALVYTDHLLTLKPKRLGNLTLPSIHVGQYQSNPINIRVQQQSAAQRAQMNRLVFFDTKVNTRETWVQGQIIYTVQLFYTDGIGGDFPQPPTLNNAVVETIVNGHRFEANVQGRRYHVLEKRYTIFPQGSGTLTIPGENFVGVKGGGGFFAQRQRVTATTRPITIQVKRIPTAFSGEHWIPAKSLSISENWSVQPPVFRVGEPVNRQLTLTAVAVPESVLPPLDNIEAADAKIYADPPTSTQRASNEGITSVQVTTMGIVPTSEGELTLPEIRIPWWNTTLDREEVAIIPASTWQVLPATGASAVAPTVTLPLADINRVAATEQVTNPVWIYLAALLGLLWLGSTWQWLSLRRELRSLKKQEEEAYQAKPEDPDESRLFRKLASACLHGRPAEAHRQLCLWGKARFPEINSLQELARFSRPLARQLADLEQILYSADGTDLAADSAINWDGSNLNDAVKELREKSAAPRQATGDLAQSLNPS